MKIDTLVLQTFGRLAGVRAFLELLDKAMPESEWHENEALKTSAEEQAWEYADFDVERQILDERFGFWLPRFTSYSVITLLHTVLETQLLAAGSRAHLQKQTLFQPNDVRGRGIDAAALYLSRLGVYDVRQDLAWPTICDLRDLRHLIVHRAGTKGQSDEHRKTAQRLARAYVGRLQFPDSDWTWYGEVWISIPMCRELIVVVEGFFDRVFDAMGLPPRYQRRNAAPSG
jgi:hypothetical protein